MLPKFFCPTPFEIPKSLKKRTETFGIGIKHAKKLAEKLNETVITTPVVIFGSAGALDPILKPGDSFLITEIIFEDQTNTIPKFDIDLATSRLLTSPRLLKNKEEKSAAFEKSKAPLVDMEMGALWKYSSEATRKNLIFIRTVIDEADQDFPDFKSLSAFKKIISLIKNWRIYIRAAEATLTKYFSDSDHPHRKEP